MGRDEMRQSLEVEAARENGVGQGRASSGRLHSFESQSGLCDKIPRMAQCVASCLSQAEGGKPNRKEDREMRFHVNRKEG